MHRARASLSRQHCHLASSTASRHLAKPLLLQLLVPGRSSSSSRPLCQRADFQPWVVEHSPSQMPCSAKNKAAQGIFSSRTNLFPSVYIPKAQPSVSGISPQVPATECGIMSWLSWEQWLQGALGVQFGCWVTCKPGTSGESLGLCHTHKDTTFALLVKGDLPRTYPRTLWVFQGHRIPVTTAGDPRAPA